ncbi:MAG: PEP-CTERM sorting domain-containing protein [Phycisphaerales bacterium]|nr:PEP-CTERM sorting domain-containing protein [Phycisphaerales bacterium]
MTTRKFSKFVTINAMAMAVVAATALSTQAAVIMDNPAQIYPNDPSAWDNTTELWITTTDNQNTSMTLNDQGGITTVNVKDTNIGGGKGAVGKLTVTGSNAVWNSSSSLFVGRSFGSQATLDINDGATVNAGWLYIGDPIGSASSATTGTVTLTNGSTLTTTHGFYLGGTMGSSGTLNILSGSTFNSTGTASIAAAGAASSGILTVDGIGSKWNANGAINVGCYTDGHGELNISHGGAVDAGNNVVTVGSSGPGFLNITSGGTLISGGTTSIGNVLAAAYGNAIIDGDGSTWTLNGSLNALRGELTVSNGGMIVANGIATYTGGTPVFSLYFNGGILKPLKSIDEFLGGDFKALVLTDSGSRPALTMQVDVSSVGLNHVFTGTGGFAKTGTGTLTLNGNQAYTGLTDIKAGKLTGEASFAGSLTIRNGASYTPGGPSNQAPHYGVWNANIAGNYTQEHGATLTMDIGSAGSDLLTVGGHVTLDGILALVFHGSLDADYYVLIDNLGSSAITGMFSDILFGSNWVTLMSSDYLANGGTFELNNITYVLSATGNASTGSLYGGNDLILSIGPGDLGSIGPIGPAVPEPASLSLLGLGTAALIARRRK